MKLHFIHFFCVIAFFWPEFSQAQTYEELKKMQDDY